MRNYFFLLLLAGNVSFCQTTKPIDTTFNALFYKIPQFSLSVEEAWQNYFPKNKMNACRRYETELKQELNRLATLSNHQSRSLSMLAGKFDIESRQYDFTKVTITKDQQLDGAVLENDKSFYSMLTDYLRRINSSMDSAFQLYKGKALAKQVLTIYNREFPYLINGTKAQYMKLNKMIIAKGYEKVLAAGNSANKYFIQLLEVRGVLLNWLLELNKQVSIANEMAATFANEEK